jgi:acetyl esterase/lipase
VSRCCRSSTAARPRTPSPPRWRTPTPRCAGCTSTPPSSGSTWLEDATGLPPGYIEVGQIDVFRDEDTAYATKLSRAGVPVDFHLHPGAPHEFDSIAFDADVARRAIADRVRVLKSI